jgi:hypothetical protein
MTVFSHHDYDTTSSKYTMEKDNWSPIIPIRHDSPNVGVTSSIEAAASEAPDAGSVRFEGAG